MRSRIWCWGLFLRLSKKILIAIMLLGILTSICLFSLLTLLSDYKQNFVRECEETNAQDNVFVFAGRDIAELKNDISVLLDNDEKVKDYEFLDSSYFWGGSKFGEGIILSWILPVNLSDAKSKDIGRFRIVMQDESISDGVYLPYLFYVSRNYSIGDDFTLTDNSKELTVKVAGFYTSAMMDTQSCYMMAILFDGKAYDKAEQTFCDKAVIVSVKTNDPFYSAELESSLPNKVDEIKKDFFLITQNKYEDVKNLKYIMVMIISAIIAVIAIAFLLITFVSLNILLNNFIHDNTKIFGIMKAVGYKSRVLNFIVASVFLSVSALSVVCGISVSYLLFPILNRILEAQSGVVYEICFLPWQSVVVLLVVVLDTALSIILSERAITKILPIQAIKKIEVSNTEGKERYTIEKSRLSLNLSLSVKNIFQNPRQSIIIFLTMTAVSFMIVFTLILGNTILSVSNSTIGTIFGESVDASATVSASSEKQLVDYLKTDERVSRYFSYDISKAIINDFDEELFITVVSDTSKLKNIDVFYEGTYPKEDNEIALGGKFAEEHGIKIGDSVILNVNQNKAEYKVCGLTQTLVHLGKECMVLRGGYEKLNPPYVIQYYISINESDTGEFISELRKMPFVIGVSDLASYRKGVVDPYVKIMTTVTVFLLVFSVFVAFMIIFNMTSYILVTKRKNIAVMRALGFTTSRCIMQISFEIFLPVVVSVLFGITVSRLSINPLIRLFLHGIGLMKPFFHAPLWQIVLAGLLLVVSVLLFVVLICRKIRNYSFRDILNKKN